MSQIKIQFEATDFFDWDAQKHDFINRYDSPQVCASEIADYMLKNGVNRFDMGGLQAANLPNILTSSEFWDTLQSRLEEKPHLFIDFIQTWIPTLLSNNERVEFLEHSDVLERCAGLKTPGYSAQLLIALYKACPQIQTSLHLYYREVSAYRFETSYNLTLMARHPGAQRENVLRQLSEESPKILNAAACYERLWLENTQPSGSQSLSPTIYNIEPNSLLSPGKLKQVLNFLPDSALRDLYQLDAPGLTTKLGAKLSHHNSFGTIVYPPIDKPLDRPFNRLDMLKHELVELTLYSECRSAFQYHSSLMGNASIVSSLILYTSTYPVSEQRDFWIDVLSENKQVASLFNYSMNKNNWDYLKSLFDSKIDCLAHLDVLSTHFEPSTRKEFLEHSYQNTVNFFNDETLSIDRVKPILLKSIGTTMSYSKWEMMGSQLKQSIKDALNKEGDKEFLTSILNEDTEYANIVNTPQLELIEDKSLIAKIVNLSTKQYFKLLSQLPESWCRVDNLTSIEYEKHWINSTFYLALNKRNGMLKNSNWLQGILPQSKCYKPAIEYSLNTYASVAKNIELLELYVKTYGANIDCLILNPESNIRTNPEFMLRLFSADQCLTLLSRSVDTPLWNKLSFAVGVLEVLEQKGLNFDNFTAYQHCLPNYIITTLKSYQAQNVDSLSLTPSQVVAQIIDESSIKTTLSTQRKFKF